MEKLKIQNFKQLINRLNNTISIENSISKTMNIKIPLQSDDYEKNLLIQIIKNQSSIQEQIIILKALIFQLMTLIIKIMEVGHHIQVVRVVRHILGEQVREAHHIILLIIIAKESINLLRV